MNKRLTLLLLTFGLCLLVTRVSAYNVVDELVGFVLDKRQNDNSTTVDRPQKTTTTSVDSSTTEAPTTTSEKTTTTSDKASPTSTSDPPSTTSESSTQEPASTSTSPDTTTPPGEQTKAPSTVVNTITITRTDTPTTVPNPTTGTTTTTSTSPTSTALNKDSGGESNGSISKSTRNTIIGVVVGVGGAIILGALAIVAFRLRRKRSAGSGYLEEAGGGPNTNVPRPDAFKATLDQYHKPPGTVNPSANF